MKEKSLPKISLIISTYNWIDALEKVLEGVSKQTVFPSEVLIADDGSKDETIEFILKIKENYPITIKHVWHEDMGFRRTVILNKTIAQSEGDYIIEMDGDVIPEKHFIEDHIEVMEKGYFVCGSRVMLEPDNSIRRSHYFNMLRCKFLRQFIANKEFKFSTHHVRGCNLAFWRSDFIAVNGYNEDIIGWGHEDHEFVYRLLHKGIKERRLKFGGVIKHLYHPADPSRPMSINNRKIQENTISQHLTWCKNGISKYL